MTLPYEIHNKRLVTFASKDATRFHLNSVHRKGDHLVSTDGHRLYMCDVEAAGPIGRTAIDGKTYCSTAWNADALKEIDCKYPNIDLLIPSPGPDMTSVTVSIPAWIGKVKAVRGTGLPILGILPNGNFCFGSDTTGRLTNVNAELIAPLAGETCVWWFKDHLSPILVVLTEKEAKWKAVIMPIRA